MCALTAASPTSERRRMKPLMNSFACLASFRPIKYLWFDVFKFPPYIIYFMNHEYTSAQRMASRQQQHIGPSMATTSTTISTEYIAMLWLLLKRRTFNMGILLNAIFIEIIRATNANLISIYVLPNCAILVAAFYSLRKPERKREKTSNKINEHTKC